MATRMVEKGTDTGIVVPDRIVGSRKKHYWSWSTVIDLSGANIAAFLLLASEIWDVATKFGHEPIGISGRPNAIRRKFKATD